MDHAEFVRQVREQGWDDALLDAVAIIREIVRGDDDQALRTIASGYEGRNLDTLFLSLASLAVLFASDAHNGDGAAVLAHLDEITRGTVNLTADT